MRAKTKPVKMASEKMAPFEKTVNFRRESILSIHIQVSKRAKEHACQIQVQDLIQSLLERESERDSYSQPDTMTLKNKGKRIEFLMKRAKSVFEMKGFE